MRLTSRVLLLMLVLLASALLGSLLLHTWAARQALLEQLELRNRDSAAALALALTQQQGDTVALLTVATAHFDAGGYSLVRLDRSDAATGINLQRSDPISDVPAWFRAALPLSVGAGQAVVTHGWKQLGRLQVAGHTGWAHVALWQACRNTAVLLLALGALAALVAVAAVHGWQRPLRATIRQARALELGRFVEADEPVLPELRTLTRTMNAMVRRLRRVLTQQADELQQLQKEALFDSTTGLLQRKHFLARLAALRAAPDLDDPAARLLASAAGQPTQTGAASPRASGPGMGLLLLRLQNLEALNLRLGRAETDRLLALVAQALMPYVERAEGSFGGRLNGTDFALCLPVEGLTAETAQSLHSALAAAPWLASNRVEVAVGAVEVEPGIGSSEALALADAALAEAESHRGWHAVPVAAEAAGSAPVNPVFQRSHAITAPPGLAGQGSQVWRSRIADALSAGRATLAEYVVLNRDMQLLHLECPLRVQLLSDGPHQPAARWLALARRSRLMPQVDLKALELALKAIQADSQSRAVHVSWPSLAAPGFTTEVARRLRQAPHAAVRLSIEWGQSAKPHDWIDLAMATQGWRELGVKVGARHADAQPQQLVRLQDLGIDHVKVDPQHLLGVAQDETVRTYVLALVRLIHGLGAKAYAGGVSDVQDLQALWACGFDAATGPAVTALWAAPKGEQAS